MYFGCSFNFEGYKYRTLLESFISPSYFIPIPGFTIFIPSTQYKKTKTSTSWQDLRNNSILSPFYLIMDIFTSLCLLFWVFIFFCVIGPCFCRKKNTSSSNETSNQGTESNLYYNLSYYVQLSGKMVYSDYKHLRIFSRSNIKRKFKYNLMIIRHKTKSIAFRYIFFEKSFSFYQLMKINIIQIVIYVDSKPEIPRR